MVFAKVYAEQRRKLLLMNHHKRLRDLEKSHRSRCSWCVQLWAKCKTQIASPQDIICDFRVVLDQMNDKYVLNFYCGNSDDSEFVKRFKGFAILLQPYSKL
jgi:hypothetical protein